MTPEARSRLASMTCAYVLKVRRTEEIFAGRADRERRSGSCRHQLHGQRPEYCPEDGPAESPTSGELFAPFRALLFHAHRRRERPVAGVARESIVPVRNQRA